MPSTTSTPDRPTHAYRLSCSCMGRCEARSRSRARCDLGLLRRWQARRALAQRSAAVVKGIALTYPVVPTLTRVRTRVVVTRVGLENPTIQATVDQLLALAPEAEVINVNGGQHGFDVLDHTDDSRRAVNSALDAVVRLLRSHSEE